MLKKQLTIILLIFLIASPSLAGWFSIHGSYSASELQQKFYTGTTSSGGTASLSGRLGAGYDYYFGDIIDGWRPGISIFTSTRFTNIGGGQTELNVLPIDFPYIFPIGSSIYFGLGLNWSFMKIKATGLDANFNGGGALLLFGFHSDRMIYELQYRGDFAVLNQVNPAIVYNVQCINLKIGYKL